MKPQIKLSTTHTPDGGEMALYQHDRDFSIKIKGLELMNSRQHESERELAQLGCAHLTQHAAPCVLIGGLGMGYTLRETLDLLGPDANVIVSELIPAVVDWNRQYLGALNLQALEDPRVELVTGDIFDLIGQSNNRFDAILLDVDNGPNAMTDSGNQRLYSAAGLQACRRALCKPGSLAIWSTEQNKAFEKLLKSCGFKVMRYKAKAYKESSSNPLFIWVAAEDQSILPPGGEEPGLPAIKRPGIARKKPRKKS